MTQITRDDIRAAVASGTITEAQAASVLALSDSRRGMRENLDGMNEPFELFKGFNEIFIVVGLTILFAGYLGVTGLMFRVSAGTFLSALVGLGLLFLLARYFILTRRMVAPAIAMTLMTAAFSGQLGIFLAGVIDVPENMSVPIVASVAAVIVFGFWMIFNVPFALFVLAGAVFIAVFGFTAVGGYSLDNPAEVFLLTTDGPFSLLTIVLGLIALILAMRFDLSDPHRVTRRSANGFWLHVVAAPAIVNTIALTLFDIGTISAQLGVLLFVLLMALFAIVIDRRSFLIAGAGHAVALAFTIMEQQGFIMILLLGAVLVLLGAKWEKMRNAILQTLPDFPGKDKLPPWSGMGALNG